MERIIGNLQVFAFLLVIGLTSFAQAQSFCVRLDNAKLYSDANTHSKVVAHPGMFTPLMGTGVHKSVHGIFWEEVTNAEDQRSWIQRRYLTAKLDCLVVNVSRTSLRSAPGDETESKKSRDARKNEAFIDLGGEDGWTQVRDEGGATYWVNIDDVWKAQSRMRISFDNK